MSNFETWWEHEGQEFLYALNTTTDDDIKLVAEIAWKNGAYCAEQAEQETEVWYCPDCGTLSETQVKCCPDWIRSRKVPKNFAITCKATFNRNEQVEQEPLMITPGGGAFPFAVVGEFEQAKQEPVAFGCRFQDGSIHDCICPEEHDRCEGDYNIPLYAAPVRTKDLTDDEILFSLGVVDRFEYFEDDLKKCVEDARAVIAADREKNK